MEQDLNAKQKDVKQEAPPTIGAADQMPKSNRAALKAALGDLHGAAGCAAAAAGRAAKAAWEETRETVTSTAQTAWKETRKAAKATKEAVGEVTVDTVRCALEAIAGGSGERESTASKIVKVIPVVGATKRYADAWQLYHEGAEASDETKMQKARVECLTALADAKIDLLLLGGGTLIRGVGAGVRGLLGAAYLSRTARTLGARGVDPIEIVAKQVADSEKGFKVADYLLRNVKPSPKNEEASSAEGAAGVS